MVIHNEIDIVCVQHKSNNKSIFIKDERKH